MAQSIFSLFGEVFVNTDKADSSLSKTESKAGSVADKLGAGIKTAAKWGTAIVGGATVAVGAVAKLATNTGEAADEIDKMSQKLGLSRETYQEWDYILSQAGVDINSMQTGMKTLTNKLDDAKNGSEKAGQMFTQLGLSMSDLQTMSREDIFEATIKGLQGMEDTTERAALANDLFGKSGQNLIPLFNESAEATEMLKKQAHELGMVMSDDAVQSGVELHDTIDTVKRTFEGLVRSLGTSVIPIVNQLLQYVIDNMPKIQAMFERIAPIFDSLMKNLLPPLIQLVETLLPVLMDVLEPIIPVVAELLNTILPPLITIIGALAKIIGAVLVDALESVTPIFKAFEGYLDGLIKFVKGVFAGDWKAAWQGIKQMFKSAFEGWEAIVKAPLNAVIRLINKAFSNIGEITIPDWVPVIGGNTFSLPKIPELAKGGTITASGSAIVGEAGAELIQMPTGARVTPLGANGSFENKMDRLLDILERYMPELAANSLKDFSLNVNKREFARLVNEVG